MIVLNNHEKCILFHLKSSLHSRDIQIFGFLTSSQYFPISHCLRGWFKIHLWHKRLWHKVYDISVCLNKNLITHFVWYLKTEERYDIETLSIDRVVSKEYFYRKIMQKLCTESLILVKKLKQILHTRNYF